MPSAVAAMTRTDKSAPTAMSITPVSVMSTESVMSSEVQDPELSQADEQLTGSGCRRGRRGMRCA